MNDTVSKAEQELGVLARALRNLGVALQILDAYKGIPGEVSPWEFFQSAHRDLESLREPEPPPEETAVVDPETLN